MKSVKQTLSIMAVMILPALAFSAAASCAADGGPGAPPEAKQKAQQKNEPESKREKLRQRIEMMMMIEIADRLELPAEREEDFLLAMRSQFRKRSELTKEMLEIRRDLEKAHKAKQDVAKEKLEARLEKLEQIKARQREIDEQFNERLEKILTVEERAKFILEWPGVQERTKEFIEEHRRMKDKKKQKAPPNVKPHK